MVLRGVVLICLFRLAGATTESANVFRFLCYDKSVDPAPERISWANEC